ncbi:MAG: hypothetical protein LAP40_27730 [Acidobacteriia bacterium]|nr:hypothetical protein [Terriglobia bacterium]
MSTTTVKAPPKHIDLHIHLDPVTRVFHYRQTPVGESIVLHHGDTFGIALADKFTIVFNPHDPRRSPFMPASETTIDATQEPGKYQLARTVRDDAPVGHYPFEIRVSRNREIFEDNLSDDRMLEADPEIVVEL